MPLTKINFSTAAAETIGKLPDSSKVTNIDNNTRFLVVEDEETKYTTLENITSDVNDIIQGGMTYFTKDDSVWAAINDDVDDANLLQKGNCAAKNIKEIKADISDINSSISSINTNITTIESTATSHAGTFASTTAAGHVFLGTDTQISDNSAPVGFNTSNKLTVENASATAYGVVKLSTDNPLSTASAPIGKTTDGQIVVPVATMRTYGTIKKSSESGTSIPCIGVTNDGQAVLNVRALHSGLEKDGNTLYIQTYQFSDHPTHDYITTGPVTTDTRGILAVPAASLSRAGAVVLGTDECPANDDETVASVGKDTAGKLAVPAATTAKAGGVLLATAETDARINAVPTIAQFKALLDRVTALETALASVTLVTVPETTA